MKKKQIDPFISLLSSMMLYIILTLPYISYTFFNFGIKYNITAIIICAFISVIFAPMILKKSIKN